MYRLFTTLRYLRDLVEKRSVCSFCLPHPQSGTLLATLSPSDLLTDTRRWDSWLIISQSTIIVPEKTPPPLTLPCILTTDRPDWFWWWVLNLQELVAVYTIALPAGRRMAGTETGPRVLQTVLSPVIDTLHDCGWGVFDLEGEVAVGYS